MDRQRRPSPEVLALNREIRDVKPKHVFFFSGVHGGYPDLRAVQGTFDREFGLGNGKVYNSFFLAEVPHKDRYKDMAADIKAKLAEGPVTIIGHSYGAAEAVRALFEDPEILSDPGNIEKLTLINISPVFPENIRDALKITATYAKILAQEARGLFIALPGESSMINGIVSASTMPSEPSDREFQKSLINTAELVYSRPSNRSHNEITFIPNRDYLQWFPPRFQDKMLATDLEIVEAGAEGRERKVRREFRRRGRAKFKVGGIFKGKYADKMGDPALDAPKIKRTREVKRLRRKLVADSWLGRDLAKLHELQRLGVKVFEVVPEYDLLSSVEKATKRLDGRADRVISVRFATHGAPWATQPDVLLEVIRRCRDILKTQWNSRNEQTSI